MILDLPVQIIYVPFLIFMGLALVIYGKEILTVLAFTVGAVAGGILAYMILRGMLYGYNIHPAVEVIVAAAFIICGGLVGKGTLAMLLALFASTVFVDVLMPFLGKENEILLMVIGLVLFLAMVPFTQKFMKTFSSFLGGVVIAMGVTPLLGDMGDPTIRIIQISIALFMTVVGTILQVVIARAVAKRKEEINWIPTKNPKGAGS
ncbi:MAG: hypothetical protein ACMUIE_09430 [Thermoplasmatota archaeon]